MAHPVFIQSPHRQFTESPHIQRNGMNCPLDTDTEQDWSTQWVLGGLPWYDGNGDLYTVDAMVPLTCGYTARDGSPILYELFGASGQFRRITDRETPDLKSRGKWKVTIVLTIYCPKNADTTTPLKNWLFINLIRAGKGINHGGSNPTLKALIRKGAAIIADELWQGMVYGGTPDSGIPSDAIPQGDSDPDDIDPTWKIDLSGITASPAEPYVLEESIVVPETSDYCRVLFDCKYYPLRSGEEWGSNKFQETDSAYGTAVGMTSYPLGITFDGAHSFQTEYTYRNFPYGGPGEIAPNDMVCNLGLVTDAPPGGSGTIPVPKIACAPFYTWTQCATSGTPAEPGWTVAPFNSASWSEVTTSDRPGHWARPMPTYLGSGVVETASVYTASDMNTHYPEWQGATQADGYKGIVMWEAEFTAVRVAPLRPMFTTSLSVVRTIQFTDSSRGTPTGWYWTFGDGTDSTAQHPLKTYADYGEYDVTLTVTNEVGDEVTESAKVVVIALAAFAFTLGVYPAVQFTSTIPGAVAWDWDWDDGTAHGTIASPIHSFPVGAGVYDVKLTVTDAGSRTEEIIKQVQLGPP